MQVNACMGHGLEEIFKGSSFSRMPGLCTSGIEWTKMQWDECYKEKHVLGVTNLCKDGS